MLEIVKKILIFDRFEEHRRKWRRMRDRKYKAQNIWSILLIFDNHMITQSHESHCDNVMYLFYFSGWDSFFSGELSWSMIAVEGHRRMWLENIIGEKRFFWKTEYSILLKIYIFYYYYYFISTKLKFEIVSYCYYFIIIILINFKFKNS